MCAVGIVDSYRKRKKMSQNRRRHNTCHMICVILARNPRMKLLACVYILAAL